jgi:hypothetical protein
MNELTDKIWSGIEARLIDIKRLARPKRRWHLIIVVPTVQAIIALIVAVSVIPVGVLTIIIRLTLIVITFGRPVIRSTRIVATVGMPCSKGNGNLGFRFRRTQSDKP